MDPPSGCKLSIRISSNSTDNAAHHWHHNHIIQTQKDSFSSMSSSYHVRPKAALLISVVSSIALILTVKLDRLWLEDARELAAMPDFSSFEDVKEKKAAFFDYLTPIIEEQNAQILALRAKLEALKSKGSLDDNDQEWLLELAAHYELKTDDIVTLADIDKLLLRVEILPPSLVLSQAAIESAWGTSRFAREGYNFFGQWCFKEGCGLIPNQRPEGSYHEVARFDTPADSVASYFRNINSHAAYKKFRQMRQQARENDTPIHGCVLAAGLGSYSERGVHYINEVRQMIRINDLTPYGEAPCANIPEAKPEPAQDVASSESTSTSETADKEPNTAAEPDPESSKQLANSEGDKTAG